MAVRFGPFRLDARSGRLSSETRSTILPEKSLRVLLALLEQPSVLVTRSELRSRLWAEGTFVDFEDGLNHAVRHLREVLGDHADHPRFIETIPCRGYRFIARVDANGPGGPPQPSATEHPSLVQLEGRLDEVWRQLADVRRQIQELLPARAIGISRAMSRSG